MAQHNPYRVPPETGEFMPIRIRGWQNGYDAGISAPPDVPATPLVRSPDYARAWAQGAVAGNADGRREGWRWAYFDGAARPDPGEGAGGPYGPGDSGERHPPESASYQQSWPCVGELPLRLVLAQFAPGSDDGNGLTGTLLAQVCADKGVDRLYLPVGLSSSGSPAQPTGDPLADAGYWHGTVSESLAEAGEAAFQWVTSSRIPRHVGLVRYGPAAEHHFFDLLPEGSRLPPGR
ncbi:hypothetical protein [Streptomyces sp. MBT33]|uniref:hypothetical protein n=1 Tax=Streptomyces sp. MBT33 TaxID=1488363 RepID=UPI0019099231|nr:hypothetical protein [Streptomyces sp. MBT33]MBK3641559.1 hypothetical protein [Streptomyces sp. MBT33]